MNTQPIPLGRSILGMFAGYANVAQIDEARAKLSANAEWFPKFIEG